MGVDLLRDHIGSDKPTTVGMATASATEKQSVFDAVEFYARLDRGGARFILQRRWKLLLWSVRRHLTKSARRAFDIFVVLNALIWTAPIMIITAIAIKLDSPGPVIFQQVRVGREGKRFICYKFRSMYVDAEQRKEELLSQNEVYGPGFKMRKDPRMTRVGRIIRKMSIDELPQLFNILRGDMTVVGPRPALPSEIDFYEFDYLRRFNVTPGLTGLPQVSGRSNLDYDRWIELDLEYIATRNLRQDVIILLKTIPVVIFGRGAY